MHNIEWHLLTIGHLSRNKYWGESDSRAYHPVLATTVVIRDGDHVILTDPSEPYEKMKEKLKQFCNLTPEDVDIVYSTHYHGDHMVDADRYEHAVCYMAAESIIDLKLAAEKESRDKGSGALTEGVGDLFRPAPVQLTSGVRLYPLGGYVCIHLGGIHRD